MKNIYVSSIFSIAIMAATGAWSADWSDTSISVSSGSHYKEPANSSDIQKMVLELTHVSGYKYGSNFFNVEFLKSNSQDLAAGVGNSDGAMEVYAVYRHQLSMSAVSGRKYTYGPIRDISLTAGFDLGTKNSAFASRPIKTVIGPTLNFAVTDGFFDLGLFFFHETNNNGLVGTSVNFDNTYQLSTAWSKAFSLGLPTVFKGYICHTGKKGKNGFGAETAAETVAHALLMFDVGSLSGKNGAVYAGFGVDHFTNKFGEKGVNQTTPIAQVEIHF